MSVTLLWFLIDSLCLRLEICTCLGGFMVVLIFILIGDFVVRLIAWFRRFGFHIRYFDLAVMFIMIVVLLCWFMLYLLRMVG